MAVVAAYACLEANGEDLLNSSPNILLKQLGMGRSQAESGVLYTCPGLKTIVIGVPNIDGDILSCIEKVGAAGYVLTEHSLDDVVCNVLAVMNGESLCSPRIANLAFSRMSTLARQPSTNMPAQNGACLTRRESEIARLIDQGLSNKEIAARLYIEVSTVKNHVHNILDKLQLHNRHSAVKYLKDQSAATDHS
jgi:DNA-binding NarL/FixJ family response regulator